MYFLALATDYDDTIADCGLVDAATRSALERLKQTGRRLILVTGRELPDLKSVFEDLPLFDRIVAENGAVVCDPATGESRRIAPAPPPAFVKRLRELNVQPLSVGESIVATREPHEVTVLKVIRELGLELQIIFNKGAVMVLPSGMNKAKGLRAALDDLELSSHYVVGVGDAENDHAFLEACGCSAAVANALPMVKENADINLSGARGQGVAELVDIICRRDADIAPPAKHGLLLGHEGDSEIYLKPYGGSVLIAGSSGIGKSTLATALTERMVEKQFEFCIFDPEGDYAELENSVSIGSAEVPPMIDEAITLLGRLGANVVINTQALEVPERPAFFAQLVPHLIALRAKTGRPHWLLIDEAHHLLPSEHGGLSDVMPDLSATILITVHPDSVSTIALRTVDTVLALGKNAGGTVTAFCRAIGQAVPSPMPSPDEDEILFWLRNKDRPRLLAAPRPRQSRRHTRKYAQGDVGEDMSFYFRGPQKKLNLRAQNLATFNQIAAGVDDETWTYHLRRGEYSDWFRNVIKDEDLADEAARIEADTTLTPAESRQRIGEAVSRQYTAPARGHEA